MASRTSQPVSGISLRRARLTDASEVANLHIVTRRVSMPYLPNLHTDQETLEWIAGFVLPSLEVWIAAAPDELAGYFALEGDLLDQFYVTPRWQRRGVGRLMMSKAKELRPVQLILRCFAINAPARAFYEKCGFVAAEFSDGQDNEEHLPDVLYRWPEEK
jgi:GNAT superfamily N-acetyltransferase